MANSVGEFSNHPEEGINGGKIFSKLDSCDVYLQSMVDEETLKLLDGQRG